MAVADFNIILFCTMKKHFLIIDKIAVLIGFLLLGIVRADFLVLGAYFFIIIYLVVSKRINLSNHFLLASGLSVVWMLAANREYAYDGHYMQISGLSIFPLFAWPCGLLGIYLIFSHYKSLIKKPSIYKSLLLFISIYWPLLIIGETVGYYTFNIHNVTSHYYAGLPFCNCMHAPHWMQVAYFLMGPIFLLLSYALELEKEQKNCKTCG